MCPDRSLKRMGTPHAFPVTEQKENSGTDARGVRLHATYIRTLMRILLAEDDTMIGEVVLDTQIGASGPSPAVGFTIPDGTRSLTIATVLTADQAFASSRSALLLNE